MRRRIRNGQGDLLRAQVAARWHEFEACLHDRSEPGIQPDPATHRRRLEAGEDINLVGWEIVDWVPGVAMNATYRLTAAGDLLEVTP